ncbi:hypothetical protein A8D65_25350 [Burkholderia cenocepacia]|uniref:hypothetical protein n=1 Tax=Burkholderiaceae TaxID=119060 RepID=UPI0009809306|nr:MULTISPECIES: hypothetical protein [Burkholderiaceae]ONO24301.1 hypothetical protein A8D65_25350 [Burkholderia cenocepacia]
MPRRLTVLILLCTWWLQAFSAGWASLPERWQAVAHTSLHAQESGHHHHEDLPSQPHDVGGASDHQHVDGSFGSPVLVCGGWRRAHGLLQADFGTSWIDRRVPLPYLEGLLRPPKAA